MSFRDEEARVQENERKFWGLKEGIYVRGFAGGDDVDLQGY